MCISRKPVRRGFDRAVEADCLLQRAAGHYPTPDVTRFHVLRVLHVQPYLRQRPTRQQHDAGWRRGYDQSAAGARAGGFRSATSVRLGDGMAVELLQGTELVEGWISEWLNHLFNRQHP